jgi:alkylation response protein AidB-like acyl-CoA dehydrogenase
MSVTGSQAIHLSAEQAMLLETARAFCRREVSMRRVRESMATERGFDDALWERVVGLGWPGVALDESVGGAQLGSAALVPLAETFGRALLNLPLLPAALAADLLARAAPGTQDDLLAELASGRVASVAALEGGDAMAAPTLAVDSHGVLDGSKCLVWDGAVADWFVVLAVVAPGEPALAVVRAGNIADTARSSHALVDETRRAQRIDFSGVAAEEVITGPSVVSALRDHRLLGALLVAAEAVGSAAACLDTTVDYLKTRRQFGRPIGANQALKHPAVEALGAIEDARSLAYHAASLLGEGPFSREAEIACRMAKAQATRALCDVADRAVQFHGAMGFTWDCDAQLYLRRGLWVQQQFGDAEHHRERLAVLLFD